MLGTPRTILVGMSVAIAAPEDLGVIRPIDYSSQVPRKFEPMMKGASKPLIVKLSGGCNREKEQRSWLNHIGIGTHVTYQQAMTKTGHFSIGIFRNWDDPVRSKFKYFTYTVHSTIVTPCEMGTPRRSYTAFTNVLFVSKI
jgi:hypothetical protein